MLELGEGERLEQFLRHVRLLGAEMGPEDFTDISLGDSLLLSALERTPVKVRISENLCVLGFGIAVEGGDTV